MRGAEPRVYYDMPLAMDQEGNVKVLDNKLLYGCRSMRFPYELQKV